MYDVGIVGCGVIGTRVADAVQEHDQLSVGGCCDLNQERATEFGGSYDCTSYTDHETLVSADGIDIVYVGVPPAAHKPVVEAALDAGRHVLCEKPIAPDAATGQTLVEAAENSDVVTAINLPFRYTPGFRTLVEQVQSGDIGDVGRIELRFRFPQWPREWQDVDWLRGSEQGGPLREVGTHFLFGVQELFGPIERVATSVQRPARDRYEESIVGHFEVDGIHGTIDLLCDHESEEQNLITVVGEEKSLSLTEWHKLIESYGEPSEHILDERRADTVSMLLSEFVAELDGRGGNLVTFEEANQVQQVVDAIFGSEGYPVTL